VRVMIRSLHAGLHPPHSSRPPDALSRARSRLRLKLRRVKSKIVDEAVASVEAGSKLESRELPRKRASL